jgi:hypothetical protein
MTTPARPRATTQLTGTALANSNCGAASGSMAEERHSTGRFRHGPDAIRTATGDFSGGLSASQVVAAVSKVTGGKVVLAARFSLTRTMVRDYVGAGRGGILSIWTGVTINTSRRTSKTFIGGHWIYLNAYYWIPASSTACKCELATTAAHAEFDVCDPGHSTTYLGFVRWSASLVYRAAEARGGGGAGDAVISLIVTRDTEAVSRAALESGKVYATPYLSGTVLSSFAAGKVFTVNSTRNGGAWTAPSGESHADWHRVDRGTLADGYVIGRALG